MNKTDYIIWVIIKFCFDIKDDMKQQHGTLVYNPKTNWIKDLCAIKKYYFRYYKPRKSPNILIELLNNYLPYGVGRTMKPVFSKVPINPS